MPAQTHQAAAAATRTPSFVCEVPLRVSPTQERMLLARLEAARQVVVHLPGGGTEERGWYASPKRISAPERCPATIPRARRSLPRHAPSTPARNMRCTPTPSNLARPGWERIWTATPSRRSPVVPTAPPIGCWWAKPGGCGSKASINSTPSKARPTRAASAGAGTG